MTDTLVLWNIGPPPGAALSESGVPYVWMPALGRTPDFADVFDELANLAGGP